MRPDDRKSILSLPVLYNNNRIAKKVGMIAVLALLVFQSFQSVAQNNDRSNRERGDELFDRGDYSDAAPYYVNALKSDRNNAEILYKLGMSYYWQGKYHTSV